eukprot:jgi/Psemu1/11523/gm1.11523_g
MVHHSPICPLAPRTDTSPRVPRNAFFMAHHIHLQALPPPPLSQHFSPTGGLTAATHTNTPLAPHATSTSTSAALRLSSLRPTLSAVARPSADASTPTRSTRHFQCPCPTANHGKYRMTTTNSEPPRHIAYIAQTPPPATPHTAVNVAHSLVPWYNFTGASLVGAHTHSIQAEALVYFLAAAFNTFAISVAPKNTPSGFCTWTSATLLPDNFASAGDPTSQVGSGPPRPQQLCRHYPPDIPADHSADAPLPTL